MDDSLPSGNNDNNNEATVALYPQLESETVVSSDPAPTGAEETG